MDQIRVGPGRHAADLGNGEIGETLDGFCAGGSRHLSASAKKAFLTRKGLAPNAHASGVRLVTRTGRV